MSWPIPYEGLAFVKALLARPDPVVFAGARSPDGAKDLLALTEQYTGRIHIVKLISADEESNNAAAEDIKRVAGRLDVVIANAGMFAWSSSSNPLNVVYDEVQPEGVLAHVGPAVTCSAKDMKDHFEVNALGTLVLFQAVWPLLRASTTTPKFIPVSSANGSVSEAPSYKLPTIAYGTSKAAQNFITRQLRWEHEGLSRSPSLLREIPADNIVEYASRLVLDPLPRILVCNWALSEERLF
jgi:NAD(P)-dependent dehydrogenase (short-subunit alcohol dehydrogenase family)